MEVAVQAQKQRETERVCVWLGNRWAGQGKHIASLWGLVMKDPKGLPEMGLYSGSRGEPLKVKKQESDMSRHGQWGD